MTKKNVDEDIHWTIEELRKSLSVSRDTIEREIKRGRLKIARIGRLVRIPDAEAQRFMEARKNVR